MSSPERPPSLLLRQSLSALVVVVLALGLIGLAVDRAFLASELAAQRERLESAAFALLAGLEVGPDGSLDWVGAPADPVFRYPASGLYGGAFSAAGEWLSRSTLGIDVPVDRKPMPRGESEHLPAGDGRPWSVYRLGVGWEMPDGEIVDITAWTAEDRARIEQAMASFRGDLWRWLGLAAAILVVAQFVLLAQPLLILRKVAREVQRIESGEREELAGRYPRELTPLTDNLNALLRTERANAELYSQALGDLAHSLKTPLAVLNSQIEAGEHVGLAELRETVAQMQERIRAELDRAAPSGRRTMLAPLAVEPVAARLTRSLNKLYPDVRFELDCPAGVRANVAERDLMEILGNLLENAAKYGAGRVRLALAPHRPGRRRAGLRITVEDDGPGIDRTRFDEFLQRGVRGDQIAEGQGLGLAIVQRIVASYHGEIRAGESTLGGLKVEAELRPG
ncbi:MAG: ATP-binding protein [Wenzhouxiangellaceae bacterium]|nr:ATP-binding protein [Wenzhouxiangellaceae bacterium]